MNRIEYKSERILHFPGTEYPKLALKQARFAVIDSATEEYHPRWGARTSNPVKSVNTGLVGSTPASSAKSILCAAFNKPKALSLQPVPANFLNNLSPESANAEPLHQVLMRCR